MKRYTRIITPTRQRLLDARKRCAAPAPKKRPLTDAEKLAIKRRKLAHDWLKDDVKQHILAQRASDSVHW